MERRDPAARSSRSPQVETTVSRGSRTFGQDLSHVDVTTGTAPGGPGTLGAAWGDRVVLDHSLGRHEPWVQDLVLAHELAHVAQQSTTAPRDATHVPHETRPDLEADATAGALNLLAGRRAPVRRGPLALSRCALFDGQRITPAHFNFIKLRPAPTDGSTGGWQAAAVRASMSQTVHGGPSSSGLCIFEVGVPMRNYLGDVSRSWAQRMAAHAANDAAQSVLSTGPVTAATCPLFRAEMQALLNVTIPGATVSAHVSPVPLTNFP